MSHLCRTLAGVHVALKNMTPNTDFSERVCVNLATFVFTRIARDLRQAKTLEPADWPKVTRFFTNARLTIKVVAHTAYSPMLKEYLSRVNEALPDLAPSVDGEDAFEAELALALGSLCKVGHILGEVDFAYLGENSAARIADIVAILKDAENGGA